MIQALVSSIPFSMLAYQFDGPLFLVKWLWQEARIITVDTTFASPSATWPVSRATLKNNMKCVRNNIHNFCLLPSFM